MSTTLDIQTLYRALQEKLGLVWLSGEQYKEQAVHTRGMIPRRFPWSVTST